MQVYSLSSIHASLFFDIKFLQLVTVPAMWLALSGSVLLLCLTLFYFTFIIIPRWASLHLTGEALKSSPALPESCNQRMTFVGSQALSGCPFPHDPCLQSSSHKLKPWVPTELSARDTKEYKKPTESKRDT